MTKTLLFLPCRAGSVRAPLKNTRPFAGIEGGLLELKLDQLQRLRGVDEILVDTNDPIVHEHVTRRVATWRGTATLTVRTRPDELGSSETLTDELIRYAIATVDFDTLIWTHVTSPFFTERWIEAALHRFSNRHHETHDSLMGVSKLQSFVWTAEGPINYSHEPVRWPRTQDLDPVYVVNSSVFIVPRNEAVACQDRIGRRPMLFECPVDVGFDIDDEKDFQLGERLYSAVHGMKAIPPN